MAQDPAMLIYYKDILVSCADWDADVLGWFLRLLCHQADKPEGLPNDVESLASLAGVKFSNFERFSICWQRTLAAKFKANEQGLLVNDKQKAILDDRRDYKEKQTLRGLIGSFIKKAKAEGLAAQFVPLLSADLFTCIKIENTNEENTACYKRMLVAYIGNGNAIVNTVVNENGNGKAENAETENFNGQALVPVMCQVWYTANPTYSRDQQPDFRAAQNILKFFSRQHQIADFNSPSCREMLLNTWQQVVENISKDGFWGVKSLETISKNMQTIYNQIKNPQKNGKQTSAASDIRSALQAEFDKRFTTAEQPNAGYAHNP